MHNVLILNTPFSGWSDYILKQLSKKEWKLIVVDVPIPKILKYLAIISTVRLNIGNWINAAEERMNRLSTTSFVFLKRTKYCERQIKRLKGKIDLIFQFQGMFMPALNLDTLDIPYVVFTDYTMKLAEKYPPWLPYSLEAQKWYKLETLLYKHASLNLVTSENTRASFIDDYGIKDDKVVSVGSGTTLDKIPDGTKSYDGRTILFIGKEFERKGGSYLLDAFEKVKKAIPDAKLVIAGPRKLSFNIDRPGIRFLGLLKDRDCIESLYREASIFAMPSLCEPFGLVFLEAMAYRLACIGTKVDAIPEIIEDGKTGFLVSAADSEILADKMILLLKNEPLMRQMGQAGFLRMREKFSWEKVAEKMDSQLDSIIKLL